MSSRYCVLSAFLAVLCCFTNTRYADAGQQDTVVRMISPKMNAVITGKQPDIRAVFNEGVDRDSLIIMLDDTDITAAAEVTDQGFHCRPPMALSAGDHVLYMAGNDESGPFEQEIHFTSRQSAMLDEATTSNEWTINMTAQQFPDRAQTTQ